MKQYRSYDKELNTILLDDQYLFAYSNFDGFSTRNLNAEFFVDYNYTLELSAFKHKKITKNNSDNFIENGILNELSLEYIEKLLSTDFNSLKQKYQYEGFATTDIGSQQILINFDKITKYIDILDGLPIEFFKTPAEEKLFQLNEYFKEFIEIKYKNWIVE